MGKSNTAPAKNLLIYNPNTAACMLILQETAGPYPAIENSSGIFTKTKLMTMI
jgi:hypothetical protein